MQTSSRFRRRRDAGQKNKKNLSDLDNFLESLAVCGNFGLAAERAGVSVEQLDQWLNCRDPEIHDKILLARWKAQFRKNLRAPMMEPKRFIKACGSALRASASIAPRRHQFFYTDDGGEKLSHTVPLIEKPHRINCLLANLARAHALICGRRQLDDEDLWPVLEITFNSAPPTRAKIFRLLIERGGTLSTSDVVDLLLCSPPTARKEMKHYPCLA